MTTRDERRAQLLEAARDVLLRFGYRKATLEDIAREAGVSRATVYNYFPNKEAVYKGILAKEIARLKRDVAASIDLSASPELLLLQFVRARHRCLKQIKDLYSVALNVGRDVLPIAQEEIRALQTEELAFLRALLRSGVNRGVFRPVDEELLAAALLSALRGLEEDYVFDDQESLANGAECLAETLLHGLLAPAREEP